MSRPLEWKDQDRDFEGYSIFCSCCLMVTKGLYCRGCGRHESEYFKCAGVTDQEHGMMKKVIKNAHNVLWDVIKKRMTPEQKKDKKFKLPEQLAVILDDEAVLTDNEINCPFDLPPWEARP